MNLVTKDIEQIVSLLSEFQARIAGMYLSTKNEKYLEMLKAADKVEYNSVLGYLGNELILCAINDECSEGEIIARTLGGEDLAFANIANVDFVSATKKEDVLEDFLISALEKGIQ